MIALLTSCGRFDLLSKTIGSLYRANKTNIDLIINEDSGHYINIPQPVRGSCSINYFDKIGQHKSIEIFLSGFDGRNKTILSNKYYLHCEDDWLFDNSYDWIQKSIEIMEADPTIIKVLCRSDSPHTPKEFNDGWGYIEPWQNTDSLWWCGFSWNPGVTRLDLLKEFIPFEKWEQEVAKDIYDKGYKVAMLEKGVCKHIGDGRSTH